MNKKVDEYIEKQKSPQKEICQKLRKIIFKTFPDIKEEMKAGVPCYGVMPSENWGKYYLASLKNYVNMGFLIKGLSKKEIALFEGNGKIMRHIEISSLKDIDENKITKLLKMVQKKI